MIRLALAVLLRSSPPARPGRRDGVLHEEPDAARRRGGAFQPGPRQGLAGRRKGVLSRKGREEIRAHRVPGRREHLLWRVAQRRRRHLLGHRPRPRREMRRLLLHLRRRRPPRRSPSGSSGAGSLPPCGGPRRRLDRRSRDGAGGASVERPAKLPPPAPAARPPHKGEVGFAQAFALRPFWRTTPSARRSRRPFACRRAVRRCLSGRGLPPACRIHASR